MSDPPGSGDSQSCDSSSRITGHPRPIITRTVVLAPTAAAQSGGDGRPENVHQGTELQSRPDTSGIPVVKWLVKVGGRGCEQWHTIGAGV